MDWHDCQRRLQRGDAELSDHALDLYALGPGNVPVAGAISTTQIYSSSLSRFCTRADFQPLATLDVFATYMATIDGSVKDYAGGNSMGQAYTWHFTTGAPISGLITHLDGSSYGGVTVKIVESATGGIIRLYRFCGQLRVCRARLW